MAEEIVRKMSPPILPGTVNAEGGGSDERENGSCVSDSHSWTMTPLKVVTVIC
jgi:hypothetical protein